MRIYFSLFLLLALGPGVVASAGSIVADFDGGNASDVVDAYPGMAGDGWEDGWVFGAGSSISTTTASVVTDGDSGYNELKTGDGNYLHVEVGANPDGSKLYSSISRDFKDDAAGIIDWTKSFTIDFTVRIDEDAGSIATYMEHHDDRYTIVESNGAYSGTSSGLDSFMIIATGTTPNWGGVTSLKWAILPGDGEGGYDIDAFVGTDIDLVSGGVYDMSITMDPEDQTCDVFISDGATSFDSKDNSPDGFPWTKALDEVGGFLTFGAKTMNAGGARSWSVDNIVVHSSTSGDLPGDLNGDGFVGGDDLDIVRSFWGQTVTAGDLLQGDPSEDGFVGGDDLDIVRANWGQGTPPAPNAVPEPAGLALLLGAIPILCFCRRR